VRRTTLAATRTSPPDQIFEARSLTRLRDEQRRQASKIVGRSAIGRRRQHLDRNMVGAGFVVPPRLARDLLFVAPGDQRIERSITARRGQLIFGPSEADQVLAVVLQRQVGTHIDVTGDASRLATPGENDRLLGREQPLGTKNATRLARVVDWDVIRMGPGGPFAG